jgi:hypothetical protein
MFRNAATLASLVAVVGIAAVSSSHAANPAPLTMRNNLTFSHAVALPGVTLPAGRYVFEAGPEGTNPNIVRVLSPNYQKLLYQGFTVPRHRRFDAAPTVLTFGEPRDGAAPPILVWYPVGTNSGHEFMYR